MRMTSAALLRRLSSSLSSSSSSSSLARRGLVSWVTFSSSFAGDAPSSSSSSSSFPAFTNNNNNDKNNRRQNHIERKIKWMSTNTITKRTATTTTTPTKKTDAYVAGNGDFFRLGIEDSFSSSSSSPSSSLSKRTFVPVHLPDNNITSIAAGGAHSLVVTESGEVFATGLNEYGQCGIKIAPEEEDKGGENDAIMNDIVRGWTRVKFRDPGSSSSSSSSSVIEIEKVISGPASSHSVCIARGGRKVFAFGKNDRGQLGIGGAFDGKEREEGTLIAFESREEEEDVIIVDGATGRETTLLISANGDAYYSGKIKTDKDERFSLIGHVKEFFFPDSTSTDTAELPQTNSFRKIPGLRNIVNCSVSDACAAFVDANGKTFTIGTTSGKVLGREMQGGEGGGGGDKNAATNGFGAIEDVLLQNVSLGFNFAVAVAKSSGALFTWGAALDDQEADSKYGLKPRLVKHEPANVNLTFTKVSSGYKHCAAITSDDRLFTWGWSGSVGSHFEDEESSAGQLGLGNDFDYPTPTEVKWKDRTTKVLDVRCGQNHTIVLASREG